ncbi:MAG: hypothetical protein ABH857_00315 [Elusimicrobiota bacterium]
MIQKILENAISGEFDYNLLLYCLSEYKNPRKEITKLLKRKDIIRVKKGLYVFGEKVKNAPPYSLEVLANLIYGPSYISCEYALSYYGLIPERVKIVSSITNKRNKYFSTPIGDFSYKYLASQKYRVGITQIQIDKVRNILIATKEKALIDFIHNEKISDVAEMKSFLCENLRIDEEMLLDLDVTQIRSINEVFKSNTIKLLVDYLTIIRGK